MGRRLIAVHFSFLDPVRVASPNCGLSTGHAPATISGPASPFVGLSPANGHRRGRLSLYLLRTVHSRQANSEAGFAIASSSPATRLHDALQVRGS